MEHKPNPNRYDEELFLEASNAIDQAVSEMWDSGASPQDIRDAVDNAINNCDV